MPGQCGRVRHNDVIPQLAVVTDMRVGHQEIVIADPRYPTAPLGAAMNIDIFTKDVVMADREKRIFTLEFEILGLKTDGRKRIKLVALADFRGAFDDDVRLETAALPDVDARTDRAIRADPDLISDHRLGTDNRRRMNHGC